MNRTPAVLLAVLALVLFSWFWATSLRLDRAADPAAAPTAEPRAAPARPDELEPSSQPSSSHRVSTGAADDLAAKATISPDAAGDPQQPEGAARARIAVVEAESGSPLPGFLLTAETQWVLEELQTDARGVVELPLACLRGRLDFQHVVDTAHARFGEPWEFLEDSVLVDLQPGEVVEVRLRALPPAARIVVEVVRASGAPAVGAEVQLAQGTFLDGVVRWQHWRFDEADDEGLARFFLHHANDIDDSFTISLREPLDGEVSDVVPIGPPLEEGPHRLVLYTGSELEVLVTDVESRPLPGLQVRIGSYHATRRMHLPQVVTDDRGRARFAPLPAESIAVYARRPHARQYLAQQDVVIARESAQTVHLVVPAELLVENLLVSGRFLSAEGEPVQDKLLAVSLDGAAPERVFTRADGTFEYRSTALAERVTVHALASVYDPAVDPGTVTVAAGTRDLEFREREDPGEALVIFQVVDAVTGKPLPEDDDVAIRVYRVPDERERIVAAAAFGIDEGTTEVDFARHPDTHWLVTAPGYRERRGKFDLPAVGDDPPILRIALERGFRREVVVRDQMTADALGGVAVLDDDGRRLATTGFDGRVVIEGDAWPEWLTFDRDGYEPLRWRARSHWYHYSDRFWLAPLPQGVTAPR